MSEIFQDNKLWVEENFGGIDLKDKRLNKRLMRTMEKIIERPDAGIPTQMDEWKDIKGCYRLLDNTRVSHKRIQTPHRNNVKKTSLASKGKVILFIQDTSEVESKPGTKNLGPIGNHTCKGVMIHSCLAVEYSKNPKVIGLANQQLWKRDNISKSKNETRYERSKRCGKESEVWSRNLKQIGLPGSDCTWVSVGDRGNDIYDFFSTLQQGWEAVIRASKDRAIMHNGEKKYLMSFARSLPAMGSKQIKVRKLGDKKSKDIELNIAYSQIKICAPSIKTGDNPEIDISIIRCWNEEEDIEWILYSTIPVKNLEDAI